MIVFGILHFSSTFWTKGLTWPSRYEVAKGEPWCEVHQSHDPLQGVNCDDIHSHSLCKAVLAEAGSATSSPRIVERSFYSKTTHVPLDTYSCFGLAGPLHPEFVPQAPCMKCSFFPAPKCARHHREVNLSFSGKKKSF